MKSAPRLREGTENATEIDVDINRYRSVPDNNTNGQMDNNPSFLRINFCCG